MAVVAEVVATWVAVGAARDRQPAAARPKAQQRTGHIIERRLARMFHEGRASGCASRRAAGAVSGSNYDFSCPKLMAPVEKHLGAQALGPYAALPAALGP